MATKVINKESIQYGLTVTMETIICYKCAIPFAVPARYKSHLHDSQDIFFCPNGHQQCYTESTETALRKRLQAEKDARIAEEQRLKTIAFNAQEEAKNWQKQWEVQLQDKKKIADKLKRTEKRIRNGVCPCCNRTFQDLQRHMATKHPEVKREEPPPEKRKRGRPRKHS